MTSPRLLAAVALALTACTDHCGCGAGAAARTPTPTAKAAPAYKLMQRTLTVEEVERQVWRPGVQARFEPTTVAEREALARLVPAMARAARGAAAPDLPAWNDTAHDVGFRVEEWQVAGGRYWALVELPERRRGAGAYLFRVAAGTPPARTLLLEAPHAYYDVGTGPLAAAIFFDPPPGAAPAALFTNTIHRYQAADGTKLKRPDSPADVCHNPDHVFTTATTAFADAIGGVTVVQLHGFGSDDDSDLAGVAAVVSAGDAATSSPRSAAVAAALAPMLGDGVRRFPEEVDRLGATTNVQVRALRRVAGADLVHVEMSGDVRAGLRRDPARRGSFAAALLGAVVEAP